VLASGLLVVHDTSGSCEDDITELTGRKELDNPLLKIAEADVIPWGDDTGLVKAMKGVRSRIESEEIVKLTGRSIG
jgi:hypothetical protein